MFHTVFSGYLTADARFNTHNEKGVINFTVAINFPTSKKDDKGDYIEDVEFYQCSKWFKTSEEPNVLAYLKKGTKVLVQANKITASHENKEGKDFVNLLANVQSLELCGEGTKK